MATARVRSRSTGKNDESELRAKLMQRLQAQTEDSKKKGVIILKQSVEIKNKNNNILKLQQENRRLSSLSHNVQAREIVQKRLEVQLNKREAILQQKEQELSKKEQEQKEQSIALKQQQIQVRNEHDLIKELRQYVEERHTEQEIVQERLDQQKQFLEEQQKLLLLQEGRSYSPAVDQAELATKLAPPIIEDLPRNLAINIPSMHSSSAINDKPPTVQSSLSKGGASDQTAYKTQASSFQSVPTQTVSPQAAPLRPFLGSPGSKSLSLASTVQLQSLHFTHSPPKAPGPAKHNVATQYTCTDHEQYAQQLDSPFKVSDNGTFVAVGTEAQQSSLRDQQSKLALELDIISKERCEWQRKLAQQEVHVAFLEAELRRKNSASATNSHARNSNTGTGTYSLKRSETINYSSTQFNHEQRVIAHAYAHLNPAFHHTNPHNSPVRSHTNLQQWRADLLATGPRTNQADASAAQHGDVEVGSYCVSPVSAAFREIQAEELERTGTLGSGPVNGSDFGETMTTRELRVAQGLLDLQVAACENQGQANGNAHEGAQHAQQSNDQATAADVHANGVGDSTGHGGMADVARMGDSTIENEHRDKLNSVNAGSGPLASRVWPFNKRRSGGLGARRGSGGVSGEPANGNAANGNAANDNAANGSGADGNGASGSGIGANKVRGDADHVHSTLNSTSRVGKSGEFHSTGVQGESKNTTCSTPSDLQWWERVMRLPGIDKQVVQQRAVDDEDSEYGTQTPPSTLGGGKVSGDVRAQASSARSSLNGLQTNFDLRGTERRVGVASSGVASSAGGEDPQRDSIAGQMQIINLLYEADMARKRGKEGGHHSSEICSSLSMPNVGTRATGAQSSIQKAQSYGAVQALGVLGGSEEAGQQELHQHVQDQHVPDQHEQDLHVQDLHVQDEHVQDGQEESSTIIPYSIADMYPQFSSWQLSYSSLGDGEGDDANHEQGKGVKMGECRVSRLASVGSAAVLGSIEEVMEASERSCLDDETPRTVIQYSPRQDTPGGGDGSSHYEHYRSSERFNDDVYADQSGEKWGAGGWHDGGDRGFDGGWRDDALGVGGAGVGGVRVGALQSVTNSRGSKKGGKQKWSQIVLKKIGAVRVDSKSIRSDDRTDEADQQRVRESRHTPRGKRKLSLSKLKSKFRSRG